MYDDKLNELKLAIIDGDDFLAQELVESMIDTIDDPMRIINEAVKPGLDVVGTKLENGELFIPDLIMAGEAGKVCIGLVTPRLKEASSSSYKGRVVMGVVHGDTHDIGKNVVKAMLIANGYEIIDLDTNVSPEKFIETIRRSKPHIVAASAYTSATAMSIGTLIEKITEAGLRDKVKMLIGGAGVFSADVERFGADSYGEDAIEAIQECDKFMASMK